MDTVEDDFKLFLRIKGLLVPQFFPEVLNATDNDDILSPALSIWLEKKLTVNNFFFCEKALYSFLTKVLSLLIEKNALGPLIVENRLIKPIDIQNHRIIISSLKSCYLLLESVRDKTRLPGFSRYASLWKSYYKKMQKMKKEIKRYLNQEERQINLNFTIRNRRLK